MTVLGVISKPTTPYTAAVSSMSCTSAIIAAAEARRSRKYRAMPIATSTRNTMMPRSIFWVMSWLNTGPM